jgi:hypothetical protein
MRHRNSNSCCTLLNHSAAGSYSYTSDFPRSNGDRPSLAHPSGKKRHRHCKSCSTLLNQVTRSQEENEPIEETHTAKGKERGQRSRMHSAGSLLQSRHSVGGNEETQSRDEKQQVEETREREQRRRMHSTETPLQSRHSVGSESDKASFGRNKREGAAKPNIVPVDISKASLQLVGPRAGRCGRSMRSRPNAPIKNLCIFSMSACILSLSKSLSKAVSSLCIISP